MPRSCFFFFLLLLALPSPAQQIRTLQLPFPFAPQDMLLCGNGDIVCAGYKREPYQDTIAGRAFFKERYVACLARFTQRGDTVWTALLPSLGDRSMFFSIVQLREGRYLLAGRSAMNEGLFCCVEEKGRIAWKQASPFMGELKKIVRKGPNEFLLAGEGKKRRPVYGEENPFKMVFLRIDSNGTLLHQRLLGPNFDAAWSCAYDVIHTPSGYLLAGGLPRKAQTQFAVARLDAKGDSADVRLLDDERGHAAFLRVLPDGNFIVGGGKSTYNKALRNAFLVKLNANGDTLWSSRFGKGEGDDAEDLLVLPSGELMIAAETDNDDISLCKLSADGKLLWEKRIRLEGEQIPARLLQSGKQLLVLIRQREPGYKGVLCITDLEGN